MGEQWEGASGYEGETTVLSKLTSVDSETADFPMYHHVLLPQNNKHKHRLKI